jgi:TatA/E family protein of Tat protein translocase
MFGPLGMPELVIIFVVALIVFGPRKLPELGKSLGKSLAEFKRASNELRNSLEDEIRIEEDREKTAKVTPPPVAPAPVVATDAEAPDVATDDGMPQPADDTTPRGAAV